MSVINRVLKDLDRQGEVPAALTPGVHSVVAPGASRAPLRAAIAVGLAVLAAALWWFWPPGARIAVPSRAVPPPVSPSPAPTPQAQAAEPRLRLSRDLALAGAPPPTDAVSRPQGAAGRAALPPPAAAPIPPSPPAKPAPASQAAAATAEPVATPPKVLVVKQMRPQTPAEQAAELWQQASRLLQQGRDHEAQARLQQVLQLDPAHLSARQSLVVLSLAAGRRSAAEALLREGMALHPGEAWFPRSLAQFYLQQSDAAQAAGVLKAALGQDAAAEDWGLYAGILAQLGRGDATVGAYREALRRDPAQGAWWIGLGLALEQTGHIAEAAEAYDHALQTRLSPELREFAGRKSQELSRN